MIRCPECGTEDINHLTALNWTDDHFACNDCGHSWGGIGGFTVDALLKMYPQGFSIGPGGALGKIVYATSHFTGVALNHPVAPSNGGYLVVEME